MTMRKTELWEVVYVSVATPVLLGVEVVAALAFDPWWVAFGAGVAGTLTVANLAAVVHSYKKGVER